MGLNEARLRGEATAAESEYASVRIDARPRTTPRVRASPVRRRESPAGCASTDRWNARHNSAIVISTPATGVHKPTSSSAAAPAVTGCTITGASRGAVSSPAIPCWTGRIAATVRRNTSPVPGQPSGNVEKRRCKTDPVLRLPIFRNNRNPKKRTERTPISRRSREVDDSAFQPDGNGVGAIVGIQFRENIFDVTLHGFFRDGELGGYLFVGIPTRNQPQNFNFPLGQGIVVWRARRVP